MSDETAVDRWQLVRGADIPPSLRLTLYALNCFQGNNKTAFCKRETLADEVGVHVDQLSRKLQALEKLGVIKSTWTKRNDRPSREHAIVFAQLRKMQRPTLTNSSECEGGTLTIPTVHSDDCDSSTLTNSSDMNIHRTSKNIQRGASLPELVLPDNLDNEEFRRAWSEWVEFRREIKKKLAPSTVSKQLKELATWGSAKSIQAINSSIHNGWQGLFDPEQKPGRATGDSGSDKAWQTLKQVIRSIDKSKPYKDLIRQQLKPEVYQAAEAVGFKALFSIDQFNESKLSTAFSMALAGDKN